MPNLSYTTVCALLVGQTLVCQARAAAPDFANTIQPFLTKNCVLCHNPKAQVGGLDLTATHGEADVVKNRDLWETVATRIRNGEMPPKGRPVPAHAEVAKVTDWIDGTFARADKNAKPDPGRVTARRLNRIEYSNTIRDLLAVNFRAGDVFPPDDFGYGFDNIGDVLSLSPVLMEKYLAAAETIAKRAIHADGPMKAVMNRVQPEASTGKFNFPAEADYDIRTAIAGRKNDMFHPVQLIVQLDGKDFKTFTIGVGNRNGRSFEGRVRVPDGEHVLTTKMVLLPFDEQAQTAYAALKEKTQKQLVEGTRDEKKAAALLDFSRDPATDDPRKRGMHVDYFEIRGPFNENPKPASYAKIFVCETKDDACGHQIVENLARRAYRRPVTAEEVDKIAGFIKLAQHNGDSFDQGVRIALEAILVSPDFLFRIEHDRNPNDPAAQHRISDFELATRLSYFLWNSMPDDALFADADKGTLHTPEVLNAEVGRMLHDPKSIALVDNFAGQWLQLRNLDSVKPDPDKFPEFDPELRDSMKQETRLFIKNVMDEDRSILDFLNAKYSFLNERLAKFYGIDGVTGNEFRKVDLTGTPRGGLLTQASVLTVSSYPNRTSVVIRGKWVLENLLNAPPPPPPPDVPGLDENKLGVTASLRQQMEIHRANAVCASCHTKMDPLGFGLENFNAIGKYRTTDGNFPVDASGTLPDGRTFKNAVELESLLASQPQSFADCVTEKMLTYALGRGLERYDQPAVHQIVTHLAANDYRFSVLVRDIVNSMPFQMRRGEAPKKITDTAKPTQVVKQPTTTEGKNDRHS
jgi:mono/diheme cytochrome c family protein